MKKVVCTVFFVCFWVIDFLFWHLGRMLYKWRCRSSRRSGTSRNFTEWTGRGNRTFLTWPSSMYSLYSTSSLPPCGSDHERLTFSSPRDTEILHSMSFYPQPPAAHINQKRRQPHRKTDTRRDKAWLLTCRGKQGGGRFDGIDTSSSFTKRNVWQMLD